MASDKKQHVLIIGAGITGLLIAHGLGKNGVPYTIFESEEASTVRRREWTMGIHWAVSLMEELLPDNLVARLAEAYVDQSLDYTTPPTNGSAIYDGVTGELLKELTSEGRLIRVSRRKLRKLCSDGIDVKFDHKLEKLVTNADQTVTAHFANGLTYQGSIALGTDGPRSTVRNSLFANLHDAAVVPIDDITHACATFSYDNAITAKTVRSIHPVWALTIHPAALCFMSVQDVADPEKPEDWKFFMMVSWMGEKDDSLSNEERMKMVKEKGAKFHEPFRTAILGIPDDTQMPFTEMNCWQSKPWNSKNGTVTLAGDAAHPMPPFRGQGMNQAIQDAHSFVQLQKKLRDEAGANQAQLIQEYSDEVAKRGGEEVALSMKNGYMMVSYSDFKNSPYMKMGLKRG